MMRLRLSIASTLPFLLVASFAAGQSAPDSNPFWKASALPFQAPPFDKIRDADYAPALEEGMKRQLAEVDAIANDPEPPTFANTIEALERTGDLLTRVSKVFFGLAQASTNDAIQKIRADEAPKLATHKDAIYLNAKLFARVRSLYERRDTLGLSPEARYLLERYRLAFVRAGAQLSDSEQTSLRTMNQEESKLTTQFSELLLADTNASAVVVDDKAELDGLSDGDLATAAQTAKERGMEGKWVLTLQNTTQQPALSSLKNRALRQRILHASEERCNHGGTSDTKSMVGRLAQLRAQRAKLLGFPTYAAFVLDDQMAKTPQNALGLLTKLVPAATAQARRDAVRLQKMIDTQPGGFPLTASDWSFYAEKVRKAEFDLDEAQVKPYFDLDRVLRDGVFFAANRLYGITFRERKDIPVYQPDVRVWEVLDADGTSLALYYGDYFLRSSKSGGAWNDTFVDQSRLIGTKTVVYNVTNFSKPAAGEPALLSFDDVSVLFHEFGHALHAMFSDIGYPTLSNVPNDFAEFPSQFNEHWALEPAVFDHYAKHYKTGKPMPRALVAKIRKSRSFDRGYGTTEYLAAALLDMAWHDLPAGGPLEDVNAFESAALKRFQIDLPLVPPRYRTTYFAHIWGGDYAAGYYAYLWSELIDDDAYYWFREHGGMTRANGQRFRRMILSRGGTEDAAVLYRAFRGRDPVVEPLLEERGLKSAPARK